MIDLRDLECLVALARCKHFARAAQECGLSQPAFSMRIRNLEKNLNSLIVKRGNRFQQFTPEGELIVAHGRAILEKIETLENEIKTGRGDVSGSLVIGVIPTAVAQAAQAAIWLHDRHPGIRTRIITDNSLAIQQGIDDRRFDAGITYSEGVSSDLLRVDPIYDEQYVIVIPSAMAAPDRDEISWAEASELPLTLLEPAMQNRRIIDRIFEEAGVRPDIAFETNGFNAAIIMAKSGVAATIVPRILADELNLHDGTVVRALVEPVVEKSISLVTPIRAENRPATAALRAVIREHASKEDPSD